MTDLGTAMSEYATSVLDSIATYGLVAAVGLACILLVWGWLRS